MTPCRGVQDHLHRHASALSDAERLQLENHLQACADCATTRCVLLRAREAHVASAQQTVGARGHAAAIAAALLEGPREPAPVAHASRRLLVGGVAFAAMAAVVAVVVATRPSNERMQVVPTATATKPVRHVLSDELTPDAAAPAMQADGPVQLAARGVVRLPATTITAVAAADLRIEDDGHVVHLTSGRISVEVDPAAQRRLRVVAPRLVVDVTGTVFEVGVEDVRVSRGSVRVSSPTGVVLVERLGADATWRVPPPPRKPEPTRTRAQAAEAAMRSAEAQLAAGDLARAIASYRAISDRYRDVPAGETALFTAARLGLRRDPTEGAALLAEYLRRYPTGRYAKHARQLANRR